MKPGQQHPSEDEDKKVAHISDRADDAQAADAQNQREQDTKPVDENALTGVSVVRGNTPRPFSFETLKSMSGHFQRLVLDESSAVPPVFPSQAPSAPPVPEELNEQECADVPPKPDVSPAEAPSGEKQPETSGDVVPPTRSKSSGADTQPMPAVSVTSPAESQLKPAKASLANDVRQPIRSESVTAERAPELMTEEQRERQNLPEERVERRLRRSASRDTQEFLWLFEYGLEMDASILNSPERLAKLALPYGPGLLKGYRLVLGAQSIHGSSGPTVAAIVPDEDPEAEVWGMLYRIPRRVTETNGDEPSLLDTIHAAIPPQRFFKGVEVVVRETYRERDVMSLTYVATEMGIDQLHLVAAREWNRDPLFLRRLATIAQRQKLPPSYIEQFYHEESKREETLISRSLPSTPDNSIGTPDRGAATSGPAQHVPVSEQPGSLSDELRLRTSHFATHTRIPLSTLGENESTLRNPVPESEMQQSDVAFPRSGLVPATDMIPRSVSGILMERTDPWLLSFALYLVCLLVLSLTFAILQGLGVVSGLFNNNFTPLGVPWLVMMYGLLGGCISSIVTLSRFRSDCPPAFIVITWFTRPFIGSILAVLSYVLLASGFFELDSTTHMPLFLLAGALAGLAEGCIFFRRMR